MQNPPLRCARCGTPAEAGQRFCAACGAMLNHEGDQPTERAGGEPFTQAKTLAAPDAPVISPQVGEGQPFQALPAVSPTPPAGSSPGAAPSAFSSPDAAAPPPGTQWYGQATETESIPIPPPPPPESYLSPPPSAPVSALTPLPAPAQMPGRSRIAGNTRRPRRLRGILLLSAVFLLVLVAGATGIYFGFLRTQTGSPHRGPGGGTTPTTGSTRAAQGRTQVQLHLAFTYATINYTLTSVQYAPGYADDPSITAGGVRVAFTEANPTSTSVSFAYYSTVARLMLPDGSLRAPSNALHVSPPASNTAGVSNWFDFSVTTQPADLTALMLQMGTPSENQLHIPLKPDADLSHYQPVTASPNMTFTYAGIQWTITKAVITYSAEGQQATAGHLYVTISLSALNTSRQLFVGTAGSYMRLQAGSVVTAPTMNGTVPSYIEPSSTVSGDETFLMPQGNTSFTLQMVAQPGPPPTPSATQTFQV